MPAEKYAKKFWYRLDASGYMYPMIKTQDTQSLFALSARLLEEVDPETLNRAVNAALTRYPFFKVKLRHGLFRYFFAHNENEFAATPDSGRILEPINLKKNGDYPFRISYYKKTVRLEIFHALTDGRGAAEFFKTVLFTYLQNVYGDIAPSDCVNTIDSPSSPEEYEDAYSRYSNGSGLLRAAKTVPEPAVSIKEKQLEYSGFGITTGVMDAAELKKRAAFYDCSVSEYLTAVILLAISEQHFGRSANEKLTGFIPVDLRQAFPSKTLRNFVTFAFAKINPTTTEPTIAAYTAAVKRDLRAFLNNDRELSEKMSVTTLMSRQPVVRFLPQAVKTAVVRSARAFGGHTQSIIVSNLGVVKLPDDAAKYVEEFYFYLNCNKRSPKNAAAATFGGKCFLSFSRRTINDKIEARTFELLEADGVSATVFSNGRTDCDSYAADEERFKIPDEKGRKYKNISDIFLAAAVVLSLPLIVAVSIVGGAVGLVLRLLTGKKVGFFDI